MFRGFLWLVSSVLGSRHASKSQSHLSFHTWHQDSTATVQTSHRPLSLDYVGESHFACLEGRSNQQGSIKTVASAEAAKRNQGRGENQIPVLAFPLPVGKAVVDGDNLPLLKPRSPTVVFAVLPPTQSWRTHRNPLSSIRGQHPARVRMAQFPSVWFCSPKGIAASAISIISVNRIKFQQPRFGFPFEG